MTFNVSSEKEENLCSIFHARFTHLRKIIPNTRQAQLMDYILLGWQTSVYKLKNSSNKWFMKEFSKIVEDTGIALSTLKRYLKEFEEEGLIERRQALYSRTTETGFDCKKGCYITITPKLISLLNNNQQIKEGADISNVIQKSPEQCLKTLKNHLSETPTNTQLSEKFNQNETFEKLNLRRLYISDLFSYENNNIKHSYFLKNVDKTEQPRVESYLKAFDKTLFKNIKEEIPEEIKNMVFGTLINLVVKNKISLSSPEQLAAEYIFALINIDYFMTNVKCLKHRNNILAKILKKNSWKTPKGFYNYFYLGKNFQEKNKIRENNWEENKSNEIKGFPNTDFTDQIIDTNKHPKLVNLENQMYIITKSISDIEKNLYSDKNFDVINAKYKKIEELEKTLFKLYDEQNKIELEIANEENLVA